MAAFEKNLIGELHGNFSIYLFTTEIVLNLLNERMMLLLCFGVAFNSYSKLWKHSIFQNTSLDRSIDRDWSLCSKGRKPSIILRSWEFLCIRDAGCRANKITARDQWNKSLLFFTPSSVHFPMVLIVRKT